MLIHITLSGHHVEYDRTAEIDAFLSHLEAIVADPATTPDDAVWYAYSRANPILDHSRPGSRGWVTREAFAHPVYKVATDLVFRKQVAVDGIDIARIASRYSLTVAQGAVAFHTTQEEIREAIAASRLGSWLKNGEDYVDPRSRLSYRAATRFSDAR